jgi:histidine triad (HIT) family protein
MSDCIFCKIASGEINASIVYQDDEVVAFNDLNPQAPTHVLVIPRKHVSRISELEEADAALAGRLILTANQIVRDLGLVEAGSRLVLNCNEGAGQSVWHVHLHLLGGRTFGWPPG